MTLGDILAKVGEISDEETILSRRPWQTDGDVLLIRLDEECRVPLPAKNAGWEYFMEIATAKEVLEVFVGAPPAPEERVQLLLFYGENDAFPDWVFER